MKQLVRAFIHSTISPLQRVQNNATRVTLGLSAHDHVRPRPALKELHCLPVTYWIQCKVTL